MLANPLSVPIYPIISPYVPFPISSFKHHYGLPIETCRIIVFAICFQIQDYFLRIE